MRGGGGCPPVWLAERPYARLRQFAVREPVPLMFQKKKKKKNILLKEMSSHTSPICGGVVGSTVWLFRAADKPYIPPWDTGGHTPHMRESQRASGLCGGLCYGGYGRVDTLGGYATEQGIRHLTVRPAVARGMPANRTQTARGARWTHVWYDPPSRPQRPPMGKRKGRHEAAPFHQLVASIKDQDRRPCPRASPVPPRGACVPRPFPQAGPRRPW